MKALLKGGSNDLKEVEVNENYPPILYFLDKQNIKKTENYKLKIINKNYIVYFYENFSILGY